jgi:hypothetical protein
MNLKRLYKCLFIIFMIKTVIEFKFKPVIVLLFLFITNSIFYTSEIHAAIKKNETSSTIKLTSKEQVWLNQHTTSNCWWQF